ncbi:MAG: signal peptidase I [Armatimonadota bacterium]
MARIIRQRTRSPRWASYAVLVGLVGFTWWMSGAVRVAEVPSSSMEPTLVPGDVLLMRIDAYRHRAPARGDLVIFHDATNNGELLVKRVVGLPGETVFCQGGKVWINDIALKEPYLKEPYYDTEPHSAALAEDELWMMGDNRDGSQDSREFGPVQTQHLVGRATAIILPANRRGRLPNFTEPKKPRQTRGAPPP